MSEKREVQPWADGRLPAVTCKARKKNGDPCRRPPIKGSTVCRTHGGAAPQVRLAAQVRLAMAADPAAARLIDIANDKTMPPAVRLAANKEILDRANVVGTQQVKLEVGLSKWEQAKQSFVRVVPVGTIDAKPATLDIVDAEVIEDDEEAERAYDRERAEADEERSYRQKRGLPIRNSEAVPDSASRLKPRPVAQRRRPAPAPAPATEVPDFAAEPRTRMTDEEHRAAAWEKARKEARGKPRRPGRR